jgi:hypothetical protein
MEKCECRTCLRESGEGQTIESINLFIPIEMTRMIVCSKCGNKRCPHANDHRNTCTNSNDTGQPGSYYQ